jgi:phage terminase large subunit-like protein
VTATLLERRRTAVEAALEHGTLGQKLRARWLATARHGQVPPTTPWDVWLILAGRGWGKTRTGAEEIAERARRAPHTRWAVVAATYADARDTCVEGESGLLHALGADVDTWNRSLGELILTNGSRIKLFSADEPERLRGPQHHGAWCDELAAWRHPEAWDQLQFGLRLGRHPQTIVTTTPKPTPLVRQLIDRRGDGVAVTTGSTFDNAANLAPAALEELRRRYEGTRLGRQELYAELLLDTPGALWTIEAFDRVDDFPDLQRLVIAVDPAVTSHEDSDESGIVAAGRAGDQAWVLEDLSMRADPTTVARRVVDAYHDLAADRVVVEDNNGADWIPALIAAVDPAVRVEKVHASRGKLLRAQPVAGLYEQGRVHHVGQLRELEDQMCSWTPDDTKSPDRLDAVVWALTALFPELAGTRRRRGVVATGAAA